jgi:hypothetical protein
MVVVVAVGRHQMERWEEELIPAAAVAADWVTAMA